MLVLAALTPAFADDFLGHAFAARRTDLDEVRAVQELQGDDHGVRAEYTCSVGEAQLRCAVSARSRYGTAEAGYTAQIVADRATGTVSIYMANPGGGLLGWSVGDLDAATDAVTEDGGDPYTAYALDLGMDLLLAFAAAEDATLEMQVRVADIDWDKQVE